MLGELHDQNGVLARKAHQDYEADLREDIVVTVIDEYAGDGCQQAHRYDQNDRKRESQTLVLRREDQEDEQDAQWKHECRRASRDELLIRELSPLVCHASWQRLLDDSF